jgi:hypothetical protein
VDFLGFEPDDGRAGGPEVDDGVGGFVSVHWEFGLAC